MKPDEIRFSLQNKSPEVLRAFLMEHRLTKEEVDQGFLVQRNWNYQIKFDSLTDGILILENLPCDVLISFQTLAGGASYAIIRLTRCASRNPSPTAK